MQVKRLLQNFLRKSSRIHLKRLEVLLTASETLVNCCRLSIVGIARGLINRAKTKSNINRIDRLVGNKHLHAESIDIYRAIARLIIPQKTRPVILVDWSSATIAERFQLLRASVAVKGRALTIYEEVLPLAKYNNQKVHDAFLVNLSKVLPAYCHPTIVTDAGFGIPWFRQVAKLGWDFVGRVINHSYFKTASGQWQSSHALQSYSKRTVQQFGQVILSKTNSFSCYLQVHKAPYQGRKRINVYGEKAARSVSIKCEKAASKAWVLAHSLGAGQITAERVIKIYQSRMQIEESFRDIKSPRFGFGLRYSGSLGIKRLSNLLLIGMLATLMAWLIGLAAKNRGIHYELQTNTTKHRNVLSVFFIGCQFSRRPIRFLKYEFSRSLQQIREWINA